VDRLAAGIRPVRIRDHLVTLLAKAVQFGLHARQKLLGRGDVDPGDFKALDVTPLTLDLAPHMIDFADNSVDAHAASPDLKS